MASNQQSIFENWLNYYILRTIVKNVCWFNCYIRGREKQTSFYPCKFRTVHMLMCKWIQSIAKNSDKCFQTLVLIHKNGQMVVEIELVQKPANAVTHFNLLLLRCYFCSLVCTYTDRYSAFTSLCMYTPEKMSLLSPLYSHHLSIFFPQF